MSVEVLPSYDELWLLEKMRNYLGVKILLSDFCEKGKLIPNPLEQDCYLLHPESINDLCRAIAAQNAILGERG